MNKRGLPLFVLFSFIVSLMAPATSWAFLVDKVGAIVNNDVVLLSDIEKFQKTVGLRKELDPLFGFSENLTQDHANKSKVLDFLIQEKLILQTFKVSDAEVEQEIQNVQKNNSLDREQLVSFLKTKGFSFNDYFDLMRIGLSKRSLLDKEIRTRVNVSDDDVKNYFYNMAMKNASIPLEYSIQIIALKISNYKTPKLAEETAENIIRALKQGESFADLAKRYSDDGSASNGGDLGYLSSDQLAEPLKTEIKKLQIGEISKVLKTSGVYEVVRLADAKSSESQKFQENKEQIRENLAKEEYKKQLFIWAERARNDAYIHTNSI